MSAGLVTSGMLCFEGRRANRLRTVPDERRRLGSSGAFSSGVDAGEAEGEWAVDRMRSFALIGERHDFHALT